MIVATLDHLDTNDLTGKRFREAFDWIASQDLEALAPGRHDIDGDAVFANVSLEPTTRAATSCRACCTAVASRSSSASAPRCSRS